jgi:hypothetical protein
MESDHSHAVLQQDNVQYQKEQAATMGEPNESRESPLANDTRAITQELIPKIYDILKDFPTAPDDESFLPLLRRLVKATATNLPRVMEEAYLDLSTHVVMQCPDTSSTNQVETASLVRPVLRILFRHRQRMVRDTHSQLQLEVSSAAKANDLNKLCDIYAQLLILEAHHEESQVGQWRNVINDFDMAADSRDGRWTQGWYQDGRRWSICEFPGWYCKQLFWEDNLATRESKPHTKMNNVQSLHLGDHC